MRSTASFVVCSLSVLFATITTAAPIFSDGFDYGGSSGNLADVSSWTSSSSFNDYVHDGGLDVAAMNGETGGAWFADRPGGNLQASLSTPTLDLSTLSAGDTVWAAVLFNYVTGGTTTHYLDFNGGSVSALGFHITSGGDVRLRASDNGGASNTTHDTGIDVTTNGTYLLLLRATKGTGTDPTDSVVDFWFNPGDASSVGTLGTVDWTTGADSKWGRDGQTMSGVTGILSEGGTTDEIRFGTLFSDLNLGTGGGPDTTAPDWTASYPQADTPTLDGFTVRAAINEVGTAYYVVVADGATPPTAAEVKAGTGSGGSGELAGGSIALGTANIEGTAAITGLASGTDYDVYFVAEDDESPTPNLQSDSDVQKVDASSLDPSFVFSESFDYGETDLPRNGAPVDWNGASSTRVFYDADGGLDVTQMNGETGGALGMPDEATTQNTSTKSFSYALSNIASDGGTLWMAAIVDYTTGTDEHGVQLTGASVSGLGFNITSTGVLQLVASDNGNATTNVSTTVTGIASGTYLVVVRATKGSGTSPTNSTVDVWFNPTDASSVGSLGDVSFSTGADSKWGRDSESYSGVTAEMGLGGAVDEIRVYTTFSGLNLATGASNNFSDWIGGFSGLGGLTGLNDDPDGDGIDNGVENFFGTNPGEFSEGLAAGAVDAGANTFTFTHPLNATPADDLNTTYRWSTDLATFHDDGAANGAGTTTVSFSQGAPSGGMVTVTATITGSVIPEQLFVAVEVTQN